MYILSIETSSKVCSVALHKDGKLTGEIVLTTEKAHAEMLTMSISSLIEQTKVEKEKIAAIAVSSGPGSYTGLRIGSSAAKGISFALDIPMIAVPTLTAMSRGFSEKLWKEDCFYIPMLDARRSEVYCQVFDAELKPVSEVYAEILNEDSFSDFLSQKKVILFGDGAEKSEKIISQRNASFASKYLFTAADMGTTAYEYFLQKKFVDTAYFEPFYLKEYEAVKSKNPLDKL
jgi:tRNA threonylcarbamoyladenosine biosynthesis protein TsaB